MDSGQGFEQVFQLPSFHRGEVAAAETAGASTGARITAALVAPGWECGLAAAFKRNFATTSCCSQVVLALAALKGIAVGLPSSKTAYSRRLSIASIVEAC